MILYAEILRREWHCRLIVGFLFLSILANQSSGQTKAPTVPPKVTSANKPAEALAKKIWDGIETRRKRLRTGMFRLSQKMTIEKDSGIFTMSEEIVCGFDYDQGKLRFDYDESISGRKRLSVNYINTPKRSYYQ